MELDRELKKEPQVEFEIPKHIFSSAEAGGGGGGGESSLNPLGLLLAQVIETR